MGENNIGLIILQICHEILTVMQYVLMITGFPHIFPSISFLLYNLECVKTVMIEVGDRPITERRQNGIEQFLMS